VFSVCLVCAECVLSVCLVCAECVLSVCLVCVCVCACACVPGGRWQQRECACRIAGQPGLEEVKAAHDMGL
jgi:hypothetical protein